MRTTSSRRLRHRGVALVAIAALADVAPAAASTPFAYAANAGWFDFAPAATARVEAGPTFLRGHAYAANFGWIDFGDGAPANGSTYGNNSAGDFGVNHDGHGELSGYAYGANIGWISFSWASATDPDRPRVDLVTGVASGFAYSANIGWINLNDLTMPGVMASVQFPSGNPATNAGDPVTIGVRVTGGEALQYQWFYDGAPISGATAATFTLPSVQAFHAGAYSVVITRSDGRTFSVAAGTLSVAPSPDPDARLLNLSTRAQSLGGDSVLIPGFVVRGSGTKRMLIRAIGPTLGSAFGVPGALANPIMALKRSAGNSFVDIAGNDNWGASANASEIVTASEAVGAFPLDAGSSDAALLVDLPAGVYSVVTSGASNSTGISLVELYDADTTVSTARVVNISNRGFVGTGADIMIPGYVVSGSHPRSLLVRAVGPALGTLFGLTGVLADPQLVIHRHESGGSVPVAQNDDWGSDAGAVFTAAVAERVGAFALPSQSKDAALVVTLSPGVYTVHASGVGATTGIALVEIYEVP